MTNQKQPGDEVLRERLAKIIARHAKTDFEEELIASIMQLLRPKLSQGDNSNSPEIEGIKNLTATSGGESDWLDKIFDRLYGDGKRIHSTDAWDEAKAAIQARIEAAINQVEHSRDVGGHTGRVRTTMAIELRHTLLGDRHE